MKFKNNLSIFLLLTPLLLISADKSISLEYPIKDIPQSMQNGNNNNNNGYNTKNTGNDIDNNIVKATNKNNFELNADEAIFQKSINSRDRYNKLLNETINLDYMMTPETRPFKTMDMLYVHPNHITTIILPEDIELMTAKASFKTDVFEMNQNSLLLKPNKDFNTGNIVVTATNKGENFIFNIVVRKIENVLVTFDSDYNKYLIENNYLSLVYQYERKNIEDKFEILQKYLSLNKIKSYDLDKIFQEDGDYDMLTYRGITYYIIKDEKFGNINYGDINFRIDTKYKISTSSNKVRGIRE